MRYMTQHEQIFNNNIIDTGGGDFRKISYYIQNIAGISPNLGKELSKHRSEGPRQRLGILTREGLAVWSNDPLASTHYYLALAEKTTRLSQFQTSKFRNEYIARIYVSGLDINALLSLSKYILNSEPSPVQRIILNLVSDYSYFPEKNREVFSGTVDQLKDNISNLN